VKNQVYTNWECIIVNDGSTDESEKVILQEIENDKRFIYVAQQNAGVSVTRNEAIKLSKGKYILPLDGDDIITEEYAQEAIQALESNPEIGLVYAQANLFGAKQGLWNVPPFEWKTFLIDNCIFCSGIFSRADYNKTTGYDTHLIHGLEDWEFWIQLISVGKKKVHQLNKVGLHYRIKEESRNSNLRNSETQMQQSLAYIYTKHRILYEQVWGNTISLLRDYQRMQSDNKRYLSLLESTPIKNLLAFAKWVKRKK
jgi:glycosyltransferase involved in cell wall biosynthesis